MIEAVVEDLAFMPVDAVLRPASDTLDPVASVSSRMDQLAGPAFAEERRVQSAMEVGSANAGPASWSIRLETEERRVQSAMEVGSAVVTGSGDLAAQFVIHAVIRGDQSNATRDTVRRALTSAWQRAAAWGMERIAGPPIGAGAGQLGLADAAELMAETFAAHCRSGRPPTSLQIVAEREEERDIIAAAIQRVGR